MKATLIFAALAFAALAPLAAAADPPAFTLTPWPVAAEISPAATPPAVPPIVVVPAPITPQAFQEKALAWIQAASIVSTALLGLLALLWQRVQSLRKEVEVEIESVKGRQDRQAIKQGQITATQEAILGAVGNVTPPPEPQSEAGRALEETAARVKADRAASAARHSRPPGDVLVLMLAALLASGCSTNSGDHAANARGRATNQALTEAAQILGKVATQTLFSVARAELQGEKADWGHSIATGLWTQVDATTTSEAFGRIVNAYGRGKARETALEARLVAGGAIEDGKPTHLVADAVATVISTAAGTPPQL